MYDIVRYDDQYGQFVPVLRDGKALSYDSYESAAAGLLEVFRESPEFQYKVEYRTVRRRRSRRG